MTACLEIVRFRVAAGSADAFVRGRAEADAALQRFPGFLGSELAEGPDQAWTLLVRWASHQDALAAQAVTLAAPGLPALQAWLALAAEVVSFETVAVRHPAAAAGAGDSSQANLGAALRFVKEGLGQADMLAFDQLLDPAVVVTTGLSPAAPIRGRDAYKQVFAGFADAWPVADLAIDNAFAVDDTVVVQFTATAVFRKDYFGVKANQTIAPLKEVHIYTLRGGKIVTVLVGAINLPFEFTMYPALKDAVLAGLQVAS